MMNRLLLLLLTCLLASGPSLQAQDVHFSQYAESSVLRNPALTGIYSGTYRAGAFYRSQWSTLGSPYVTMAAQVEGRFHVNRRSEGDYVSIGLLFYSDKAGRASLKTTGFYPCINYNKRLSSAHPAYLSLGFTAGYLQRSFDPGKLTFDNQYQNGRVEPGIGPGEDLPLASLHHWDLGTGLSINSSVGDGELLTYVLGLSAYHFTQPRATFAQQYELMSLATRWNASLSVNFKLMDAWHLEGHSNVAVQGAYHEAMLGGLLCWTRGGSDNGGSAGNGFGLGAGAQVRFGDAIIPILRLDYKGQHFGISYDINTSGLKAATGMRGGLEVSAFFRGFSARDGGAEATGPRF